MESEALVARGRQRMHLNIKGFKVFPESCWRFTGTNAVRQWLPESGNRYTKKGDLNRRLVRGTWRSLLDAEHTDVAAGQGSDRPVSKALDVSVAILNLIHA